RKVVFPGVARAEESRNRGPLVVRRAAAQIPVAGFDELERRSSPVRSLRGLDVEMVVDGHGRKILAALEATVDHRVSAGLGARGAETAGLQELNGVLSAAVHFALAVRLDGDRGNLDESSQRLLELAAPGRRVLLELVPRKTDRHGTLPPLRIRRGRPPMGTG